MLSAGDLVGPYRIVRAIGEGGMGVVYQAEHTLIGRLVALKVLAPRYSSDPDLVRRLFAEAKAVNRIDHENIVEVTDFVSTGEHCGLVMEFLSGISLEEMIQRGGAVDLDRLLPIACQVARGMAAAHTAGIVHRDLKPANIFVCDRGDRHDLVKIIDFGASNLTEAVDSGVAPVLIGTPLYIAPELAGADDSDHRVDIYSLGAVLYEAATGQPVFDHFEVRELLMAHVSEDPTPPHELPGLAAQAIPPRLERLILRCLDKSPEGRPATMGALYDELAAIAAERSSSLATFSLPDLEPPTPAKDEVSPVRDLERDKETMRIARRRRRTRRMAGRAAVGTGFVAAMAIAIWLVRFPPGEVPIAGAEEAVTAASIPAPTPASVIPIAPRHVAPRYVEPAAMPVAPVAAGAKATPAAARATPARTQRAKERSRARKVRGKRQRRGASARTAVRDKHAVLDPFR